jgi:hypothetical protein
MPSGLGSRLRSWWSCSAKGLLVNSQLRGRYGLEAAVGDRLSTLDRESVGPGLEACLGALEVGELAVQVLRSTGVKLVLVEVLRAAVSRLDAVRPLLRAFALESGERVLDAALRSSCA